MLNFKILNPLFLASLILLVSGPALAESHEINLFQEEVEIKSDQEVDWNGYKFSYKSGREFSRETLTITNPNGVLNTQFSGEEFYKIFNKTKKISEDLYFRVNSIDRDEDSLEMTVWTQREEFGASEINVSAPEYIVKQAGEEFTVPLTVKNTGGVEETYELNTKSSQLISTDFTYQGYNITKLVVKPGQEKEITADISLDKELPSGTTTVNFTVSNRSSSFKEFRFQVVNSSESQRELRMTLDESYTEKKSGETLETTVRVENIGDSLVEDVEPSISTSDNWNYTASPEEAANISSEEFRDFELEISVPSTATSGDYFIDIGLENTEDFDERNLRVNVSDSSSGFGLIGAVLALMAILLVTGVYKVFGRR